MQNSLLAAILALWTCSAAPAQTVPSQDGAPAAKFVSGPPPIVVSPAAVDFGFIPPGAKRVATVSLQNTSTQPITLIAVQPTCACTTTTNMAGQVIPPGGSVSFDAELGASVVPGPRHATVKVLAEGYGKAVEMDVRGEVAMPLRAVPSALTPPPAGAVKSRVVVESLDRKPFRIRSSNGKPPEFLGFDPAKDEPRATYVLRCNFEGLLESEMPAFWVVETDREDCPVIGLKVRDERFATAPVMRMNEYALNLGVLQAGEPKEIAVDLKEKIEREMVVRGGGDMGLWLKGTEQLSDGTRVNLRFTPKATAVGAFVVPLQLTDGARAQPLFAFGVVRPAAPGTPSTEPAATKPANR